MEQKYPHLCSPITLGRVNFRNRMFSTPMGGADITADGCVGPRTPGFYELRAKGGAAAVTATIVHLKHSGLRVTPEGLICKDPEGKEVLIPGKTVICAVGQRSNREDVLALRSCAPWVREIGNCNRVSNTTNAVYQGYHVALDI